MPMNRKLYPDNWEQITAQLKAQVGNRCEECGAPNGEWIIRDPNDTKSWIFALHHDQDEFEFACVQPIRVVLTTAHLDHNPGNNDRSNLRVLCQRCHLAYDLPHHIENAKKTRQQKKTEAIRQTGQLNLFEDQ